MKYFLGYAYPTSEIAEHFNAEHGCVYLRPENGSIQHVFSHDDNIPVPKLIHAALQLVEERGYELTVESQKWVNTRLYEG